MRRFTSTAAVIVIGAGIFAASSAPGDWRAWLGREPDARAEASQGRVQIRQQLAALRARRAEPTPTPGRSGLHGDDGRPWRLALRRNPNDGRLVGRVVVPSGDGVVEGRIEGSEQEDQVAGSVFDESGRLLATFSGRRADGRLSGTYRTAAGESGEWGE